MASRGASRRERDNDFSAVGKIGRRTGITLQTRPLDENGIEEISGMFSSPRKPSPLRKSFHARDMETEQSTSDTSMEMVGMDSTGLTPAQAISTRKSLRGPSMPPPKSASPKKSGILGSARRSTGVDLFSGAKDVPTYDPEDQENSPAASPNATAQRAVRRSSPSPEKSPLRDITLTTRAGLQTGARVTFGTRNDVRRTAAPESPTTINKSNSEVLTTQNSDNNAESDDGGVIAGLQDEGRLPDIDDDDHDLERAQTLQQTYDDEEADQTFEPVSDVPPEEPGPAKANSRRKRKSEAVEPEALNGLPSSPIAKKARKIVESNKKASKVQHPSSKAQSSSSTQTSNANAPKPRGRSPTKAAQPPTQFSAQQEAELEDIVERVKARPGPKKSLYVLRRETPDDDGVTHTRSGRVSVKPLAYWRNERCVYGGSPGGSNFQDGARFPLNSIKEIIRTDEVESDLGNSKSKRKVRKGKSKARNVSVADSDSDEESSYEDPDAEPWESAVGIFRGNVAVWDAQQQAPLENEQEDVDMAYAPASIQTREVPGSSFRYAKLLSTRFFGSGIVDLPPGGLKRPKNSRKMHMSFFVAKGRVTVQMGPLGGEESRFSVGKGGFWQVPRGNQYSIGNEMEKPARIFFSQGCEVTAGLED